MTASFDLVIRNGLVTTATEQMRCDIGISDGIIVALGRNLSTDGKEIDAGGNLVLPGGIDSHCHIEQKSSIGIMNADDFYSGTVSAAFGGNTTVIPFAAQHRGESLKKVVEDYHERATPKAVIDYAFHMIISDPTSAVMTDELPYVIEQGYKSFKVFMTYDLLKLDDYQILDILALARKRGALTMAHAENHDMMRWLADRLIDRGYRAPKFHAVSHAMLAEAEATSRVIRLAELLDVPIFIVHVSAPEAMEAIREAQSRGVKVYGETCPQYLLLTADDLDLEGMDGAKFCCSPPPRDKPSQEAMWRGITNGTFQIVSSDHAPFRFDESGKLIHGKDSPFKKIPNGIPGLEVRMPLLFSEGVHRNRIDIHKFIDLTCTQPAKIFGLLPRKGTVAIGSDADLAIWDPNKEVVIRAGQLHDKAGYSPYEGRRVRGWPVTVISRGRVVVHENRLQAEPGSGKFIPRTSLEAAIPSERPSHTALLARRFGAENVI
jgi:dihydropyrimidinase